MPKKRGKRTFTERLYHTNVLTDGNLRPIEPIDLLISRLKNPSIEDEGDQNKEDS